MNIEDVCDAIAKLSDKDFAETEAVCLNQTNFQHPLVPKTAQHIRATGQHNLKQLKLLKALQLHIKQGKAMDVEL